MSSSTNIQLPAVAGLSESASDSARQAAAASEPAGHDRDVLADLLARMRHSSDFPAMSEAIEKRVDAEPILSNLRDHCVSLAKSPVSAISQTPAAPARHSALESSP